MSRRLFDPLRNSLAHRPSVDTSTPMSQSLKMALFIVVLAAAVTACGDDSNGQEHDAGPSDDTGVPSDAGDVSADTGTSEDAARDVYEDAAEDVLADDADVSGDADEALDHQSVLETLSTAYGCSSGYCHGGGSAPDIWGYDKLVDAASECDGSSRVVAGDPEASLLWQKVSPEVDASDVCGSKMPGAEGISAEDAQMVYDWIAAGAPR
jgi:hypothetical protein